jgi:hypothetical protein
MSIKNVFLILTVVLFSFASMAQSETAESELLESSMDSDVEDFLNQVNMALVTQESGYIVAGVEVNDRCSSLIDKSGGLGSLGRFARDELMTNMSDYAELMSGDALKRHCTNYTRLSIGNRALVWALILTTMAHFESSCDSEVEAKGPNGTAKGLWQLHEGEEQRYDGKNRDQCLKNASGDPVKSVRCTLGMLAHQMSNSGGNLFSTESYWDVLRPDGQSKKAGKIEKALKNSQLCTVH